MRVSGRVHSGFWKAHVKQWALSQFEDRREKRMWCRSLLEQVSARILGSGCDEATCEKQFNMVWSGGVREGVDGRDSLGMDVVSRCGALVCEGQWEWC